MIHTTLGILGVVVPAPVRWSWALASACASFSEIMRCGDHMSAIG